MARGRQRNHGNDYYGMAWRTFLRDVLRSRVRTKAERDKLAKQMGSSVHYVNAMLYKLEGGIDAWTSAISHAFDLKAKDMDEFFVLLKSLFRKQGPISEADKVWTRLDAKLTENEKFYWVTMIEALITADKEFKK